MKELSIEDKAKAYNELIKRLNKAREDVGGYTFKSVYDAVMSELKESEDEKWIPKEIIKYLKEKGDFRSCWIAWLERQCEKGINGKNREIPFSEQKPNPCGNCGIATNNCQNFPCVIRDGEQKPAEKFPKYKKGDILTDGKNKYEVLSWDYTETGIAAYYMKGAGFKFSCNCEEVDKKLYIVEQKPDTDFSDLRTWKYIVDAVLTEREGIGQYLNSPFTEEVAKKLQKRFGKIEQKPQCMVSAEAKEELLKDLEVKEVDLEKEYKDFVEEDPVYNKLVNGIVGKAIAKHFFELGMAVSNKAQKGE